MTAILVESTSDKLNKMAYKYLEGLDFNNISPVYAVSNYGESVTVFPTEEEFIFNLNKPRSLVKQMELVPHFKKTLNEIPGQPVAVIRGVVGYKWASEAVKNPALFLFGTMNVLNSLLSELQMSIGKLDRYDIEIMNSFGEYFKDLEDIAGLEIRVVVKNKLVG